MQNLSNQYLERQRQFTADAAALRKRYDRFSIVRLIVFFASVGLLVLLGQIHWAAAVVGSLLFVGGFYRLMQWHLGLQTEAKHLERLADINAEEDRALAYDFSTFPNSAAYLNPHHPYALDLDIFGEHSVFQFFCRANTAIGQERLAEYLSQPTDIPEIEARQEAITELRPLLDWRQHFRAKGHRLKDDPKHLHMLHDWLADENLMRGNTRLTLAMRLAIPWFLVCVALWIFYVPWQIFLLLWMVPPGLILSKTKERVDRIHLRTMYTGEMLARYGQLLQQIENQNFTSKKLQALRAPLVAAGGSAARQIGRLSYIVQQLNVRYNFFAILLNLIGLWELYWVFRLEKWKAGMRQHLPVWFDSLREFEALSSLANGWFNNPDWHLPKVEKNAEFSATGLGHPLIHPAKRIGNDLHMPTRGHIKLVTGSNMAGKSTFLRTVGLNAVLAQAGSAVCAAKLELPPLQVWTSMRTVDDLHESTSSFFAELKRLKVIIEAVDAADTDRSQLPVFFLLDEILKGTNSVDRHTGSAALIRQLIEHRGGGIIATHDLELGRLEAESDGAIENFCMEVEVQDGQLRFDYKLKPGVSESFNATLLMQQMGIRVRDVRG